MGKSFIIEAITEGLCQWKIKVAGVQGLPGAEQTKFNATFPEFKKSNGSIYVHQLTTPNDPYPPIEIVQKIMNELAGQHPQFCTSTACWDGPKREYIWTLIRQ